jgi:hypothetical protein
VIKKYFLRYIIETPNSITHRKEMESGQRDAWKINFGDSKISLFDYKFGLISDFYLLAETITDAEQKSKAIIETVLNFLDYSTSSASAPSLLVIAYDATDKLEYREYKQIIYKSLLERNIKVVNQKIFGEIFEAFDKNQNPRIVRASSWLRKGLLEKNYIDKFIAYWTGLEAINDLLCNFFEISNKDRKWKCYCGRTIFPVSSIGIKTLFLNEIKIENRQFKKIRNARNDLIHGNVPLDNAFVEEIKQYCPICREALIVGIGKLLGVRSESLEKIIKQKSTTYSEKMRFLFYANLKNFSPPKLEEFGKQPGFEITDDTILERVVDKQGKLDMKHGLKLKVVNANFDIKALEIWGGDDSAIERVEIGDLKINQSKEPGE